LKEKPNVFLITVDDLRADHLGYMGYKNITPNIDAFAKQNVVFTQAMATGPMTPLSFPSILYSLYPSEYYSNMGKHRESLASFLKKLGYKTAAFNSNPHFRLWGFNRGFDYFEDFLYITKNERDRIIERIKRKIVKMMGRDDFIIKKLQYLLTYLSADIALPYADAETTNKKAFEWINKNKNQNIFCWVHYMDPHYPFFPPKKYVNMYIDQKDILKVNRLHKRAENFRELIPDEAILKLKQLYDGEVRYLDKHIWETLEFLKKIDIFDNSIIVFTADHGELFGDHGRFGHQYDVLYKKQLHVPLIIKFVEHKKEVIKSPVSLIDIPFTIAEMLNQHPSVFNGTSFQKRKYIISEGFKLRKTADYNYLREENMIISCQYDNWKMIVDDIRGKKELYDLGNDPDESINLYCEEKEIACEIDNIIKIHKSRIKETMIISQKISTLKKSKKI